MQSTIHEIKLSVKRKVGGDPRFGKGHPGAYTIDGEVRADLELHWNHVHRFFFDAKVAKGNHPLYVSTSQEGGSGAPGSIMKKRALIDIRKALEDNPEGGGSFDILPSRDLKNKEAKKLLGLSPAQPLFYQCAVHPNMGWNLIILEW